MQPQLRHHEAFKVAGLRARASHGDDSDVQLAHIGGLWDRFFDERVYERTPHRTRDMRLYGVYSGYESDAFDVTTGVAVSKGEAVARIEAGDYLVFDGRGDMPRMIQEVWQAVSDYFAAHPDIRRSYRSDFEAYSGPDRVAVHIGVILD
jgi:predicted transcriptional regulator YdeE